MKELITAIGLLFFVEGLFLAIFPSRIKNMLEIIKNTPENKLKQLYLGKGMFLRALEINFIHPIATNCKMVVKIEIPEPAKFEYYRNMELKRFQKLKQNNQ